MTCPAASVLVLAVTVTFAATGCGGGTSVDVPKNISPAPQPATGGVPWPAPPNSLELARKAGLKPEPAEELAYHVHAHLDVFVNGQPVIVPAGIGINIDDPGVHTFKLSDGSTAYGGIAPPCAQPCISPLHTHDVSGILHTESATPHPNDLGQFFTEWNVALDRHCVGGYCRPAASVLVYVDGDRYTENPRAILLANHREIAIVIGTPPKKIPTSYKF
jgi:hypothetical protein